MSFASWEEWISTAPEQTAPTGYPDPRAYQWTILASSDSRLLGMQPTEQEALDYAETLNQSQQLVGEVAVAVFKGYPGMVLP
ncbi:MAG TPA: hypothetical protein V6C88_12740 [Chroococcidiopsis sp.]